LHTWQRFNVIASHEFDDLTQRCSYNHLLAVNLSHAEQLSMTMRSEDEIALQHTERVASLHLAPKKKVASPWKELSSPRQMMASVQHYPISVREVRVGLALLPAAAGPE
jgi:hypothetical protein